LDIQQRNALLRHGTFSLWASFLTLTQSWWHLEVFTFADAWSISTECFFYVCFALWMLLPRAAQRSEAYVRRASLMTLMGVFLIFMAVFAAKADVTAFLSHILHQPKLWWWFQYTAPYMRVGEFVAGVCAARMFMVTRHEACSPAHQRRANILCCNCGIAILLIIVGHIMCGLNARNIGWLKTGGFFFFLSVNFGYAPFLAYLLYACSRYPNVLTRWCSSHLMQAGGDISYPVYLLQFEIFHHVLHTPVAQRPSNLAYEVSCLKMILYMLLTTIAAYYSYNLVEVPFRRFLREWLSADSGRNPASG
jgi:peptidoglycan/LPS O-acetylase OafA/YrhL